MKPKSSPSQLRRNEKAEAARLAALAKASDIDRTYAAHRLAVHSGPSLMDGS